MKKTVYLSLGSNVGDREANLGDAAAKLSEIDESTGALLRFDGERVAAFVTSFNATDVGSYRIVGTKGQIHVDPAYEYAEGLAYKVTVDGKTRQKKIQKRDQFAPELLYFSDCILLNREPEPGAEEGLADVRVIRALYRSAETGRAVELGPFERRERPSLEQEIRRPPIEKPQVVHAQAPSGGS